MDQEKLDALLKIGADAFVCLQEMTAPLVSDLYEYRLPDGTERRVSEDDQEDFLAEHPDAEELLDPSDLQEQAREAIQEDPLSIELTGTWAYGEKPQADGYVVLLSTGGPAVRIVGDIDASGEPCSAHLETQDWLLPWTRCPCDEDVLLAYVGALGIQVDQ